MEPLHTRQGGKKTFVRLPRFRSPTPYQFKLFFRPAFRAFCSYGLFRLRRKFRRVELCQWISSKVLSVLPISSVYSTDRVVAFSPQNPYNFFDFPFICIKHGSHHTSTGFLAHFHFLLKAYVALPFPLFWLKYMGFTVFRSLHLVLALVHFPRHTGAERRSVPFAWVSRVTWVPLRLRSRCFLRVPNATATLVQKVSGLHEPDTTKSVSLQWW